MSPTAGIARRIALMTALGAAVFAGPPATAGDFPIELVPMVGVRGGLNLEPDQPGYAPAEAPPSISYGLDLDVYLRPDAWFEVFVDRQTLSFTADPSVFGTSSFDMNVDYLQFGGGYEPSQGKVAPFVSAALGLTRYGADTGTVDHTLGLSGSIGGGFKAPMGKRLKFKLEVLGYATINDAALSVSCGPGCFVQFASSGWFQFAARVGLAIRL
jgi:hypothetical protein